MELHWKPENHISNPELIEILQAIGQYIASLFEKIKTNCNYELLSDMEIVTGGIGAHLACQSMSNTFNIHFVF